MSRTFWWSALLLSVWLGDLVAVAESPGRLKIVSDPAGATVGIDGEEAGKTPFKKLVEPGTYHVKLSLPGYPAVDRDIAVNAERESYFFHNFAPPAEGAPPSAKVSSQASPERAQTSGKPTLEFVPLPAGTFHSGCEPQDTRCEDDEIPGRTLTVQAFSLEKTDVTVAEYRTCTEAGACTAPGTGGHCNWGVDGKDDHPVNCIDWQQAETFCRWAGGRLPTAEEWEYAAKGGTSRIYPWGDQPPDKTKACFGETCDQGTIPADAPAGGASKQGLPGLAGNVFQWTASDYDNAM